MPYFQCCRPSFQQVGIFPQGGYHSRSFVFDLLNCSLAELLLLAPLCCRLPPLALTDLDKQKQQNVLESRMLQNIHKQVACPATMDICNIYMTSQDATVAVHCRICQQKQVGWVGRSKAQNRASGTLTDMCERERPLY